MPSGAPSVFWRQFLLSAFLIILAVIFFGAGIVGYLYAWQSSAAEENLRSCASAAANLARAYSADGSPEDSWDFQMGITLAADAADCDILLLDDEGTVLACSCSQVYCEHLGKTAEADLTAFFDSDEMLTAAPGGIYDEARFVYGLSLSETEAETDAASVRYLMVSVPRTEIHAEARQIWTLLLYSAVPCLLAALAIAAFVTSRQAEELNRLAEAARSFAGGDFSVRLDEGRSSRELRELASSMNGMAEALERTETRRSEFISGVSHELKTPMTTIAGFVDGILDGTIPPEKRDTYLRTVSEEVHRLDRLVRSMLEVSRSNETGTEGITRDRFDAVELFGRTLITYEQRITAKALQVEVCFPELEVSVLANSDSVTRVISNLLDNAVKFSPEGGLLTVGIYTMRDKAYLYIRNEGQTIPPEELSLLFDRFHKTDKSRSEDRDGVGLGLYLVRSILQSHGETITVSSEDGVTEFTFTLALADPESAR